MILLGSTYALNNNLSNEELKANIPFTSTHFWRTECLAKMADQASAVFGKVTFLPSLSFFLSTSENNVLSFLKGNASH
jgi:hypothetical protein